ncbi:MAG TPA: hypothetical protein VLM85_06520, partial [Polyangiaceae bacterium]|nr:hypothetical protein [Polyangiaceae bacterium]
MKPLEHPVRIGSSTIACTLAVALAGCTSSEALGSRTAAPPPTAALAPPPTAPVPGTPPAPPPPRQPLPSEEPDEALAVDDDFPVPLALPALDVAMLEAACSSD